MSGDAKSIQNVLLAWERPRVLYTVFLASFSAWRMEQAPQWHGPSHGEVLFWLVLYANVFYCIGPLGEAYLLLLFGKISDRLRIGVFALGILISAGVVSWLF